MTRIALSLLLAVFMGAVSPALPALAQGGCYSDQQIRTAVQQGQARPLSNFLAGLLARFGGGQVTGSPQLCQGPGGLTYVVTVIVRGQVMQLRVNALTGAVE